VGFFWDQDICACHCFDLNIKKVKVVDEKPIAELGTSSARGVGYFLLDMFPLLVGGTLAFPPLVFSKVELLFALQGISAQTWH